jgi:hypothetical protein
MSKLAYLRMFEATFFAGSAVRNGSWHDMVRICFKSENL